MNLPERFCLRMKEMLGTEYDSFLEACEQSPVFTGLRINTTKQNAKERVFETFGNMEAVPWCNEGFYADKSKISGNHPYHMSGLFYFQEPSAMVAVSALPIDEGDFVLDLCAAPGGKSTQAGAKLNNTGLLISNEIIKKRSEILSENIERFGFKNTIVTNESPQKLAEKYSEFFDKIIVDAPCSGEGMFRKEPQAVTEWSVEHVESCALRQRNILDCAVKLLKKGGMLIYSTCTFSIEENEENARYLINEHGLTLQEIKLDGISQGIDMPEAGRLFPHIQQGEGHFAVLFKKEYGSENAEPMKKRGQNADIKAAEKLYREFENKFLNIRMNGEFYLFGEKLYLMPFAVDIDKIKVVRLGLLLGECKKNRFEPSHALALALTAQDFKNTINLSHDDKILTQYLTGNVIQCDKNGYTAVLADGFPVGWGKASQGMLKNHYPKYLRLKR